MKCVLVCVCISDMMGKPVLFLSPQQVLSSLLGGKISVFVTVVEVRREIVFLLS